MNPTSKIFVIASMLFAVTGATAGPDHAQQHGLKEQPAPTMSMEAHMQGMEKTMLQIQQTEDVEERMRLMREHIDQMKAAMRQMHAEEDVASGVNRPAHRHKYPLRTMQQMSRQVDMQQKELKRLHDHNKMK